MLTTRRAHLRRLSRQIVYLRNLGRCTPAPGLALCCLWQGMAAVSQLLYVHMMSFIRHVQGRQGGLAYLSNLHPFRCRCRGSFIKIRNVPFVFYVADCGGRGTQPPLELNQEGVALKFAGAGTLVIPQGRLRLRCYRGDSVTTDRGVPQSKLLFLPNGVDLDQSLQCLPITIHARLRLQKTRRSSFTPARTACAWYAADPAGRESFARAAPACISSCWRWIRQAGNDPPSRTRNKYVSFLDPVPPRR